MTNYLIFIYDNDTYDIIVEHLPFHGDINGAKEYAFSLAHRTNFRKVGIMIYEYSDYHNSDKDPLNIDIHMY